MKTGGGKKKTLTGVQGSKEVATKRGEGGGEHKGQKKSITFKQKWKEIGVENNLKGEKEKCSAC